jgi:hypothetical protein
MRYKCEFPSCTNEAVNFDRFFQKAHCSKHSFDKYKWPERCIESNKVFKTEKRSTSTQFGKKYFKRKK